MIYDLYIYDLKSSKLYYSRKNKSIDTYYIVLRFHYYKVIIFNKIILTNFNKNYLTISLTILMHYKDLFELLYIYI